MEIDIDNASNAMLLIDDDYNNMRLIDGDNVGNELLHNIPSVS